MNGFNLHDTSCPHPSGTIKGDADEAQGRAQGLLRSADPEVKGRDRKFKTITSQVSMTKRFVLSPQNKSVVC